MLVGTVDYGRSLQFVQVGYRFGHLGFDLGEVDRLRAFCLSCKVPLGLTIQTTACLFYRIHACCHRSPIAHQRVRQKRGEKRTRMVNISNRPTIISQVKVILLGTLK